MLWPSDVEDHVTKVCKSNRCDDTGHRELCDRCEMCRYHCKCTPIVVLEPIAWHSIPDRGLICTTYRQGIAVGMRFMANHKLYEVMDIERSDINNKEIGLLVREIIAPTTRPRINIFDGSGIGKSAVAKEITDTTSVMLDKIMACVQKLRTEDTGYIKKVNENVLSAICGFCDKMVTSFQETLSKISTSVQGNVDKASTNADGTIENTAQRMVEIQKQVTSAITGIAQKLVDIQKDATSCLDNYHRASMKVIRQAVNALTDIGNVGNGEDDEDEK
jgi:hypothetical protein